MCGAHHGRSGCAAFKQWRLLISRPTRIGCHRGAGRRVPSPTARTRGSRSSSARLALVAALLLFRFKLNSAWLVLGGGMVALLVRWLAPGLLA
ncbi:hypothetical protein [Candidatus Oscillochloris fontis]|uniref:hypothetical protein n=1 Tax=Candidatus Oscillochloris fontis TaxID=2496868 RepID=UPI00101BB97B|nr:hypothetical protein [Candidatus Oscillochloris fontis]